MRGLVAGSTGLASETGGRVIGFALSASPLPRRLLAARSAAKLAMREFRPNLIVSHFALYTWPCIDLLQRPLVVHFHGPWALEGAAEGDRRLATKAKLHMEGAVYRRAERCIVLSEAFGQLLHETYKVDETRISIVPGGVDTSRYSRALTRSEARESLGWPVDRPIVLAIRRLARRMGLENLIAAMVQVRSRHPDALLLISGKGLLAQELHARVEQKNLENNVRLLGYLPDEQLPIAYRAADLSVVPSVSLEGFGLVTTESLASGTPVMVTPIGGLPEAVRCLSKNLVFENSSVGAIAEGLIAALSGSFSMPDEIACRNFAKSRFDWTSVTPKIRAIYAEAAEAAA